MIVEGRNEGFKDVTPAEMADDVGDQSEPIGQGALGITVPVQMLDLWEDFEMAKASRQCEK